MALTSPPAGLIIPPTCTGVSSACADRNIVW